MAFETARQVALRFRQQFAQMPGGNDNGSEGKRGLPLKIVVRGNGDLMAMRVLRDQALDHFIGALTGRTIENLNASRLGRLTALRAFPVEDCDDAHAARILVARQLFDQFLARTFAASRVAPA